ncbi:choice-of-anchor M domain-containing protein [Corynebacterium diphtheriae]|uniref:choice-of-anchor M domain-containing protein n=1 Tax=Corynebacterium diphtheriae TaxID=1717 RepID=UPI0002467BA1|nr:choice-of-anchor M domain-containing protein [Corynebacterium diphtheriae]MCM0017617.1 choice-of-anchor M domain-containing protein [Corynebacterium diphtheriae bv. mitis]AEX71394.1 putative surface-anchored membrane protein [Corynebacterium diphtheriae CDCE 8392]MCM0027325.1 choice-of-anchor M domain-containing protein [Corynebacterium diphtheriae bv. mitis]MCM0029985.1 choice-of-anchor M domain-containing protein [Corynebacterium diphtheriae bv. mitis]MCM0038070.1 choice-of-anchor M domai
MKRLVYKLSALGLVLGISMSTPAAWAQSLVLETGHIDAFNVTAEDGGLKLTLKEDATGQHVLHDPQDVILKVKQEAMNEDVAKVAEIGKPGYLLPMAQDAGLIWPGWDTQGVREGGFSAIDINFKKVSGPGEVYMFKTGSFGGTESLLAGGNYEVTSGSSIHQDPPSHVHTNWVFTEPGTYTMCVQATGNGSSSNVGKYVWQVGDGGPNNVADCEGNAAPVAAPASKGKSAAATSTKKAASTAKKQLPDTGPNFMTLSFIVLGLGLMVFGAGMVRLVRAGQSGK